MTEGPVRIGDWLLEPSLNQLSNDEKTVTVEPLAAAVLAYFAKRQGEVVSVDELVENLWNRSFVGDSPVYRVVAELRRILGDDAREPRYIATIRKRGYRLVASVEYPASAGSGVQPGPDERAPDGARPQPSSMPGEARRARYGLLAAGLVALAAAGYFLLDRQRAVPEADPGDAVVIAVMPFESLSSAEPDPLVRGLTDAVATRIGGVSEVRVISQNSTRQFGNSDASARSIGEQLGAGYLITGTALRRTGADDREWLRINAHLVDVATESYLWSQTYEQPLTDLFELQASIAERVARQLDSTLFGSGNAPATDAGTPDFRAYSRYLTGRDLLGRGFLEADLRAAVEELEAAVAADPGFARAHAALGLAHLQLYAQYWDRSVERLELARATIDRALELDPELVDGHFGLGSYYLRREMLAPALEHLEYVRVNRPSHTDALAAIAQVFQRQGRFAEAVEALEAASRFDPLNHLLLYMLGQTRIVHGDYAGAEVALERAITLRPELLEGYLFKAVLYMAWRGDEARAHGEFERAAARVGMNTMMETMLQLGISGSFRFAGPTFLDALRDWELEGSAADPAAYYLAMADHAEISGDRDAARNYYDQARVLLERRVEQAPNEPFYYAVLGSAYAGAGMVDEALATGRKLLAMAPVDANRWDNADYLWYMAEIYVLAGLHDEAIDQVEAALGYSTTLTRAWIRVEPFWEPLRGDPRFRVLVDADDDAAFP